MVRTGLAIRSFDAVGEEVSCDRPSYWCSNNVVAVVWRMLIRLRALSKSVIIWTCNKGLEDGKWTSAKASDI